MTEVFVFENPHNIDYNGYVYAFLRPWYCPELQNHTFNGDTWFKVPAIVAETKDTISYTAINNKVEMSALMLISDNGRLLKTYRTRTDQKVPQFQMQEIERTCFDISQWEQVNQQAFPYALMFEGAKMQARYKAINGATAEAYFSVSSDNKTYQEIRKVASPKPCNCGKKYVVQ